MAGAHHAEGIFCREPAGNDAKEEGARAGGATSGYRSRMAITVSRSAAMARTTRCRSPPIAPNCTRSAEALEEWSSDQSGGLRAEDDVTRGQTLRDNM